MIHSLVSPPTHAHPSIRSPINPLTPLFNHWWITPPSSHTLMLLIDSSSHPSIHPCNRPPVPSIHPWIVHLPIHLSLCPSIHSSATSLSSHPCNDPHILLPTHPSTHLLTKLSTQSSMDHPSIHSHMIYSYRHSDDTLNPTLSVSSEAPRKHVWGRRDNLRKIPPPQQ